MASIEIDGTFKAISFGGFEFHMKADGRLVIYDDTATVEIKSSPTALDIKVWNPEAAWIDPPDEELVFLRTVSAPEEGEGR